MTLGRTRVECLGVTFRNPVLLAAGTCGFGRELMDVVALSALGGIVTKSVTMEPRAGNPPPRVVEWSEGMLNSVGLANPGVERVRVEHLPWIRDNLAGLQVLVSVAGHREEEYAQVVALLDDQEGFLGYELNLSCPNDQDLAGAPFALDERALVRVVSAVRRATQRPVVVKLAPNAPDLPRAACAAVEAGADGITLVNTMPALVFQGDSGQPALGAGPGGMSGPALRPVGLEAVRRVRAAVTVPVFGVGGIVGPMDARDYLRAGADLIQIGTATFADPRTAERIALSLAQSGIPTRMPAIEIASTDGPDRVSADAPDQVSAVDMDRGVA